MGIKEFIENDPGMKAIREFRDKTAETWVSGLILAILILAGCGIYLLLR